MVSYGEAVKALKLAGFSDREIIASEFWYGQDEVCRLGEDAIRDEEAIRGKVTGMCQKHGE